MLKEIYQKEIVPKLKDEIGKGSPYGVPTLVKIVLNCGVGREKDQRESLDKAKEELSRIAGQTPSFRLAKKAISSFSIREGDLVGLSLTLRGRKMWDFFEKLVKVVLPRTRDFAGISRKSFDGHGNLTVGIGEHTAFPEIDPHKVEKIRGLEITIVTNAGDDEKAYRVLKELGMPFRD
ncbi:50S ribosomal protein L5 [candidate division WWE3 bacterium RIFCSPHIGHO2_01_FULL_48_15]|uniref:Large ribosomal subunit protein uL5 n=1 Tax=candidate division WWE3 bacterium RIFCSPHIGHO2_01_FULL_48_15 TaxID=1802619 RepID=A0A1F4VA08_UNCKA|nr:MAG: 50S ribosomal protein L5 [candidate division WWE3 bacterium RIFCSPHIGHO2_01_FULL_48_15]